MKNGIAIKLESEEYTMFNKQNLTPELLKKAKKATSAATLLAAEWRAFMTKRCRVCIFLFATLLLLVACTPKPQQTVLPGEKPGTRAVFRRMYDEEISSLNYLYTSNTRNLETCANLVDCLVEYDPYGKIIPSLAESWSSNEESTVWTFSIRPGVKWVDYQGNEVAEVTAQDWVDAARWVNTAANESGVQYIYDAVVKNADDYYAYTSYLLKSENGTKTVDTKGTPIDVVPTLDFSEVGFGQRIDIRWFIH